MASNALTSLLPRLWTFATGMIPIESNKKTRDNAQRGILHPGSNAGIAKALALSGNSNRILGSLEGRRNLISLILIVEVQEVKTVGHRGGELPRGLCLLLQSRDRDRIEGLGTFVDIPADPGALVS